MDTAIIVVALPNLMITCLSLYFFLFQQHSTQLTSLQTFSSSDFSPTIFLGFIFSPILPCVSQISVLLSPISIGHESVEMP